MVFLLLLTMFCTLPFSAQAAFIVGDPTTASSMGNPQAASPHALCVYIVEHFYSGVTVGSWAVVSAETITGPPDNALYKFCYNHDAGITIGMTSGSGTDPEACYSPPYDCTVPKVCPTGSFKAGQTVAANQSCDENICPQKQGEHFALPDIGDSSDDAPSLGGVGGYDYGCEFIITGCTAGTCAGCYTGNGTYNTDTQSKPSRRWKAGQTIGIGGDLENLCDAKPSYTGHPDWCDPLSSTYDARTDTCPTGTTPTTHTCPELGGTEQPDGSCQWCFGTGCNGAPPQPPNLPQPPPPDQFGGTVPHSEPPAPPVIDDPGYTDPQPGDTPGNPGGNYHPPGWTDPGGTSDKDDPDHPDQVSWGAFTPISADGLYKRRYTSVKDMYQNKLSQITGTPLFTLLNAFKLPVGVGQEPVWTLDMTGLGLAVFTLSIPSWMFGFCKAMLLLGAMLRVRSIIFGA